MSTGCMPSQTNESAACEPRSRLSFAEFYALERKVSKRGRRLALFFTYHTHLPSSSQFPCTTSLRFSRAPQPLRNLFATSPQPLRSLFSFASSCSTAATTSRKQPHPQHLLDNMSASALHAYTNPLANHALENTFGTLGAVCWSVQLVPQIVSHLVTEDFDVTIF